MTRDTNRIVHQLVAVVATVALMALACLGAILTAPLLLRYRARQN